MYNIFIQNLFTEFKLDFLEGVYMKKNENVDILVGKIISSEKLIREFSELDSFDEVYDFCQSIHGGYTKEEFALFIDEILSSFIKESSIDISLIRGMEDDDIKSVSGGSKVDVKRIVAASLASLSFITIPKFNSTYAANPSNANDTVVVQQQENQEKQGKFSKAWSAVKSKLSSLKDMIIRNKGKVTVGALILAAISICIYKRDDISNSWNNLDWVKEKKRNQYEVRRLHSLREQNNYILDNLYDFNGGRDGLTNEAYIRMNDDGHNNVGDEIEHLRQQNKQYTDKINEVGGEHWYSNIPVLAQMVAAGGATVAGAKTIWDVMYKGLGGVGSISKAISDLNNARYSINSIAQDVQYQIDLAGEKSNKKEFDRKEAGERLEEGLSTVRGQEKAKKGVRGFFNSVTMERERLKALEKKDSHAHVVVFNGASGTGKSFTAGHLASAISNASPYVMSASEVDVNSSKSSIIGQLFGDFYGGYGGGYGGYGGSQNFVKYIEDHPNDGVVIINEYDKMCVRDSKDHPLDEVMRTFIDEGKATINGKTIDCSGVVFILTTNESDGSLQGKVFTDPVTKKLVDPTVELDSTGSRTIVKHDKSFLNRLTIVSFDNLSSQEYGQIARDKFAPTIEFLKTNEGGNIDLTISDESYVRIAKYTERINEGARTIDKILGELFTAVVEKVSKIQEEGGEYLGKKFEAVYDDQNNDFSIK